MNAEELWYTEVVLGLDPKPLPLPSRDLSDPTFPVRLALAIALGVASHRPVRNGDGTTTWYWPRWPEKKGWTRWWAVPDDVAAEAFKVLREARDSGRDVVEELQRRLRYMGAPWSLLDPRVSSLPDRTTGRVRRHVLDLFRQRSACPEWHVPVVDLALCEIALMEGVGR